VGRLPANLSLCVFTQSGPTRDIGSLKCYNPRSNRRRFSLPLTIRPATIDELSGLSDLCFRSKAVWGYDEEFMEACRGELSFEPRDLDLTPIAVAEHDGS